jgi:SNF2 family DNA or RNA helicase
METTDRNNVVSKLRIRIPIDKGVGVGVDVGVKFVGTLKKYQTECVEWMISKERRQRAARPSAGLGFGGILGDVMGLGKTVQMIGLIISSLVSGFVSGPTLLVLPVAVLGNWRRELEKFSTLDPSSIYTYYGGSSRTRDKNLLQRLSSSRIVLTTYGVVKSEGLVPKTKTLVKGAPLYNVRWSRVVCDECHQARNSKTGLFRSLLAFRESNPRVYMWLLSGTLIHNDLSDIVSYCLLLGLPEDTYASKRWWLSRVSCLEGGNADDANRAESELSLFRKNHLLSRGKDVLALPPLTTIVENIELNDAEKHVYNSVYTDVVESFRKFREATGQASFEAFSVLLVKLMRLRQTVTHPGLIVGASRIHEYFSKGGRLRERQNALEMGSSKINWVISLIKDPSRVGVGDRFLIFSQWTSALRILEHNLSKHGIKFVCYDGGMSTSERECVLRKWYSDPSITCFVSSLMAGGVGLNLVEANRVIILDPWYSPALEDQAQDRSHRIGQRRPVVVYKAVASFSSRATRNPASHTIDHAVHRLQGEKRRLSMLVVKGLGTLNRVSGGQGVTQDEMCDLMGDLDEQFLARKKSIYPDCALGGDLKANKRKRELDLKANKRKRELD